MRFDLKTFWKEGRTPYHVSLSLDLSQWDFPGYEVPQPVCGSFTAEPTENGIYMECEFTAEIQAECARCLAPVTQRYTAQRNWEVRESDLDKLDEELPVDEKGVMDLAELVYEELLLEVPPVLLCSPDCEGLCPVCGKRKADGCTCQSAEADATVDERLAILKQLLN